MTASVKRTIAALVGAAALLESVSLAAAESRGEPGKEPPEEENAAEPKNEEEQILPRKEETVYVFADADGGTERVLVSSHLKNPNGEKILYDETGLREIENVKGNETYAAGSWTADGSDIYYQGVTDRTPPVEMKVTYILDGAELPSGELPGRSGALTIRYDFVNLTAESVSVGGKEEEMPVPFAAVSAVILENDVFHNVTVRNGKTFDDGDRTAVVGFTFPGLNDALGLDEEELPSFFEIKADVTDFSLTNTFTVVTNEVFGGIGSETGTAADSGGLADSMESLNDAMEQLADGSQRLADGLGELLEKSGALVSGADSLSDGSERLRNGAFSLSDGADTLSAGVNTLSDGLETLDRSSAALNEGASQVFDALLSAAQAQLTEAGIEIPALTAENYHTELNRVLEGLSDGAAEALARQKAEAAVREQRGVIEAKVSESVRAQVKATVLSAMNMSAEEYDAGVSAGLIPKERQLQVEAAVEEKMNEDAQKEIIAEKTEEQIAALAEKALSSDEGRAQIKEGKAAMQAGREKITALLAQLDSYNEFYRGLAAYTDGVSSAKDGAGQLRAGAATLKEGAKTLCEGADSLDNGIGTMKEGLPGLIDGITRLRGGADELHDGIVRLDEEGISRITDVLGEGLAELVGRLEAVRSVSEQYPGFAGKAEETKFIYRTESIG